MAAWVGNAAINFRKRLDFRSSNVIVDLITGRLSTSPDPSSSEPPLAPRGSGRRSGSARRIFGPGEKRTLLLGETRGPATGGPSSTTSTTPGVMSPVLLLCLLLGFSACTGGVESSSAGVTSGSAGTPRNSHIEVKSPSDLGLPLAAATLAGLMTRGFVFVARASRRPITVDKSKLLSPMHAKIVIFFFFARLVYGCLQGFFRRGSDRGGEIGIGRRA